MIDPVVLMRAVTRLCMLRFPPPEDCRPDIGMLLGQICHSEERLDWLVTRALQLYGEWPGPLELRALYSECWTPADGVKSWSEKFPQGYPKHQIESIPGYKGLPIPETRMLDAPRDEPVSEDPKAAALVESVAEAKKMPTAHIVKDVTHRKLLDMGFLQPEGR